MIESIFHVLRSILPYRVHQKLRPIWWWLSGLRPVFPGRNDLVSYDIQDHVRLNVYWTTPTNGQGPALAVSIYEVEVFKFDYFGEGDGHFHVDFGRHFRAEQNRIYLPEITREAQIDRSFFELRRNMYYYLKRHRNHRIRNFKIDTAKLEETLVPIRKKMVADIQKVIAYQKDP